MTDSGSALSLVSWNLKDLTGSAGAVTKVLRALAADVYCLQEVPRRVGGTWRLHRVLQGTGLRVVAGGRGSGGTAIVVSPRVQTLRAATVTLPVPHWYVRRRGAAVAELGLAGRPFVAASIHLPLTAPSRVEHARLVRRTLTAWTPVDVGAGERGEPWRAVVAGDFNEPPGEAWAAFEGFHDPAPEADPTFPAAAPDVRLDTVLISGALAVAHYSVPTLDSGLLARASDHRPIRTELVLHSKW